MNGNIWRHWRNIYTHYTNVTNICTYILHTYYTKYLLINLIKTPTCAISGWNFPTLRLGLATYYMSTCRYLLSIMCQQSTCSQQTKDVTHHCHEVHELNDFSNTEAWWNTYLPWYPIWKLYYQIHCNYRRIKQNENVRNPYLIFYFKDDKGRDCLFLYPR